MTFRYRLLVAARFLAVTAIALAATWATSLLPITNPVTATGLCIVAGAVGLLLADTWLPYPCTCHRKDPRP
jgi:hypothetical protein